MRGLSALAHVHGHVPSTSSAETKLVPTCAGCRTAFDPEGVGEIDFNSFSRTLRRAVTVECHKRLYSS